MKCVSSLALVFVLTAVSPTLAAETEIKPVELSKSSQGLGDMTPVIVGIAVIGAGAAAIALASGGGSSSSTTSTTGTTP